MREWLIKKIIGNKPVIANVTIEATLIKASEAHVLVHKSNISEVK
ncbi:hypothetical protein [Jeotgalibacillus proteolyticus]|nr:hypothetical protein [Jeotgalibacillus proteolyticus]